MVIDAPCCVDIRGIWIWNEPDESVAAVSLGPEVAPFRPSLVSTELFGGKPWPVTEIVSLLDPADTETLAVDEVAVVLFEAAVVLLAGEDVELVVVELVGVETELVDVLVLEDDVVAAAVAVRRFTVVGVSIEAFRVYAAMNELLPVALIMRPLPLKTVEPDSPVVEPALAITVTA